jgi:hypothetical protein
MPGMRTTCAWIRTFDNVGDAKTIKCDLERKFQSTPSMECSPFTTERPCQAGIVLEQLRLARLLVEYFDIKVND